MDLVPFYSYLNESYLEMEDSEPILDLAFTTPDLDFLSLAYPCKNFLDMEPGETLQPKRPKVPAKLTWGKAEDEALTCIFEETYGKGWETAYEMFPHFSKTEVKKRFRALRKVNKFKYLPDPSLVRKLEIFNEQTLKKSEEKKEGNKSKALEDLKLRLSQMEEDLLSSCSKIKSMMESKKLNKN